MLSFSRLERAETCPASEVLFQVESSGPAARRGTVAHKFFELIPKLGVDEALRQVPEEHRETLRAVDLSRLPLSPEAYAAEVAWAYDVEADTARELGRGLDRHYPELAETEIPGSADLAGLTAERVVVLDWKTGRWAPRAKDNLQLGANALAAARAWGRSAATVGIIHVPLDEPEREPRFDLQELDAVDLDAVGARLYGIWEGVREAREDAKQGRLPPVREGEHCAFCPAFSCCPAKVQLAMALRDPTKHMAGSSLEDFVGGLSVDNAREVLERLEQYDQVAARIRSVIDDLSRQAPIPLGNGEWYGPHEYRRTEIDGLLALEVLAQKYGADVAAIAGRTVKSSLTKRAVETAIASWVQKTPGAKRGKEIEIAMRALVEAGAAKVKVSNPVGKYRQEETGVEP